MTFIRDENGKIKGEFVGDDFKAYDGFMYGVPFVEGASIKHGTRFEVKGIPEIEVTPEMLKAVQEIMGTIQEDVLKNILNGATDNVTTTYSDTPTTLDEDALKQAREQLYKNAPRSREDVYGDYFTRSTAWDTGRFRGNYHYNARCKVNPVQAEEWVVSKEETRPPKQVRGVVCNMDGTQIFDIEYGSFDGDFCLDGTPVTVIEFD